MYKVKRSYKNAKKQPWLVDLLLKINPKSFAHYEAKEDCMKCLKDIHETIKSSFVHWKRGNFNLTHIRTVKLSEDKLEVKYKSGKSCLLFYIDKIV